MKEIRTIIEEKIRLIPDNEIGIAFSGGIDSLSILFSSLDLNKKVTLYSFTLDNHISTDFSIAKRFAKFYEVNFKPIFLPTNIEKIKETLLFLNKLGAEKKTDYVCSFPMYFIYKNMKENTLVNGLGADGHFCISKKGMIHYKNKIQEFRDILFSNPNYAQKQINLEMARYFKKQTIFPYLDIKMIEAFKFKKWNEINKPRQKQATLDSYSDYFKKIKVRNHTNLQLGDSRIQTNIEQLLATNWNSKNYKSIVGIFNEINRGFIK
tara:strand:- start:806 stop:1600 length:795 start_codon:yes stop_codon:yes gene_type:complete